MKLFVVLTSCDYETSERFEGVFTTKKKAQKFINDFKIVSDETEIVPVILDSNFGYKKEFVPKISKKIKVDS